MMRFFLNVLFSVSIGILASFSYLPSNAFCDQNSTIIHQWQGSEYSKNSVSQKNAAERILEQYTFNGNESVLDIGCGDGKITALISKSRTQGLVAGLDKSESMIHTAKSSFDPKEFKNLEFILGDAAKLDYDSKFDLVVSFSALQWVKEQLNALQGIHRSLKPNGTTLIGIPFNYPEALAVAIQETEQMEAWEKFFRVPNHALQYFFTEKAYAELLTQAQFDEIQVKKVPSYIKFGDVEQLSKFISQWLPYLQAIPADLRASFMKDLMQVYTRVLPTENDGSIWFKVEYLEAIAKRVR